MTGDVVSDFAPDDDDALNLMPRAYHTTGRTVAVGPRVAYRSDGDGGVVGRAEEEGAEEADRRGRAWAARKTPVGSRLPVS